jgi:hypothetical protein
VGGQGIVILLEGALFAWRGETVEAVETVAAAPNGRPDLQAHVAYDHDEEAWGYCTNFVVHGEGLDVEDARCRPLALGSSAVVVGEPDLLKVHVHTREPGEVLSWALGLGELDQVRIANTEIQTRRRAGAREATAGPGPELGPPGGSTGSTPDAAPTAAIGVVSVAAGGGLAEALRELGASTVVAGDQTMNPSVGDLLAAVEALPDRAVILLPNNPNILVTAARVPDLASRSVAVVPSRSVPQGMAALATFSAADPLETNLARMTESLAVVRTIEVTRAIRDAEMDGVGVGEGDVVALLDERLVAAGPDEADVVRRALDHAGIGQAELVTIFSGDEVTGDEAQAVVGLLAELAPTLRSSSTAVVSPSTGSSPRWSNRMRQRIAVVTYSTAALPKALRAAVGITVVPLDVRFGDESFRDGVDLTNDAFMERLA